MSVSFMKHFKLSLFWRMLCYLFFTECSLLQCIMLFCPLSSLTFIFPPSFQIILQVEEYDYDKVITDECWIEKMEKEHYFNKTDENRMLFLSFDLVSVSMVGSSHLQWLYLFISLNDKAVLPRHRPCQWDTREQMGTGLFTGLG